MSNGKEMKSQQEMEEHARAMAKAREAHWKEIAASIARQATGGIRHNNLADEALGRRVRVHRRWAAGTQVAKRRSGQSRGM